MDRRAENVKLWWCHSNLTRYYVENSGVRKYFKMYFHLTSCFSKSLENLELIPRLVSVKPPMCHNTDTMWHTENRIPRYKPQITTKSIPKFSALRLKRSIQDTGYGERMHAKLKALILVLGLLQVVGTVKTKGSEISTGPTTSSRHSKNLKLQTVPPPIC